MNYTMTEKNIVIINNGSIINIPSDDLRYEYIRRSIKENKDFAHFIKFKNILPKGFDIVDNEIYVKQILIPNKIIKNNKHQLEELKNHLYDHYSHSKGIDYLNDVLFLDKEGEIIINEGSPIDVSYFRKQNKKDRDLIKSVLKSNSDISILINKNFNANEIKKISDLNLKSYDLFYKFYNYYFKNKNSKLFKAIEKSNLNSIEWTNLLEMFKNEPLEVKNKITNFKILIKRYQNAKKNFKDDYPIIEHFYKKYYKIDNTKIEGYKINFVKNRDEIAALATLFQNCLRSRSDDFIQGRKIIFTLEKDELFIVGEFNHQEIKDFEVLKESEDIELNSLKERIEHFLLTL